jgi:hypothetical protein
MQRQKNTQNEIAGRDQQEYCGSTHEEHPFITFAATSSDLQKILQAKLKTVHFFRFSGKCTVDAC